MARELNFKIKSNSYFFEPVKFERKKLYGFVEKIVQDGTGSECTSISFYPELSMFLPKDSTTLGVVDENGLWVEKSNLKYVYEDGSDAVLVTSSFDGEIELKEKVSIEILLEHNISAIYMLQSQNDQTEFIKEIQKEKEIFTFEFNYRTDYVGDPAFLIENEGVVFILVGKKIEFEYLGLADEGELDNDEEESEEAQEDDFDFSMM